MTSRNKSLTVIVPLFQEEDGVEHLAAGLTRFREMEGCVRSVEFVLVDDGSTDRTHDLLRRHFAAWPAQICRHEHNRGLTAALATGLAAAKGELIGWLDSDLTYEPAILSRLAAQIDAGAEVACASCYHPEGGVEGVPRWRLLLSRGASRAYRRVTGAELHTFTCMVRVWRREVLERCAPVRQGFLGVTESLVKALLAGHRVVETPAVLRRRRVGQSKMRVLRVGLGHLALLRATLRARASAARGPGSS